MFVRYENRNFLPWSLSYSGLSPLGFLQTITIDRPGRFYLANFKRRQLPPLACYWLLPWSRDVLSTSFSLSHFYSSYIPLRKWILLSWSLFSLIYCSSSVATISRPPTSSSLKITYQSFQHAAPCLGNKLSHSFPHPHVGLSPSHYPTHVGSTLSLPPLSPSITPSLFHSRLKAHPFLKSFPP